MIKPELSHGKSVCDNLGFSNQSEEIGCHKDARIFDRSGRNGFTIQEILLISGISRKPELWKASFARQTSQPFDASR
jgi:hypothetical protein